MSETVEAPVVEQTPEQVSASRSAGFNKVRGLNPPTESTPDKPDDPKQEETETTVTETTKETEAKADEPKEEPIAGLGLTPSEVKAQLASIGELRSSFDAKERKLQGQMGSLKSEFLEIVKSAKTETPATVARVNATLKNLRAAGYDDMADVLEKDFAEITTAPAVSVDAEAIKAQFETTLNTKLAEESAKYEKQRVAVEARRLLRAHPDLPSIRATSDFQIWRDLQPLEVRNAIGSSTDSDFMIDQISAFKGWKQKADPTEKKQKNAARLEGNVTPQGSPSPTPSEPTAKEARARGFNKVHRLTG